MTKYKVTTDGETPCLSGHGIIEVEPIDGVTAIVTVEGNGVMLEQHAATCAAILDYEEIQIVTPEFAKWLSTTSFAGQVEPGDQWDTAEAWPSAETMRHARACYKAFVAGDIETARISMVKAQEPFV